MQPTPDWPRKYKVPTFLVVFFFSAASHAAGQAGIDAEVQSNVVSVALFKNGLAVVKRQVQLDAGGVYQVEDVPEPVHGTFLVESNGSIEARVERRQGTAKNPPPLGINLQEELMGLKVTIYGRTSKTAIIGTVLRIPRVEFDPGFVTPATGVFHQPTNASASRFLLLKTEKGISYVDFNEIASLEAEGRPQREPQTEYKPVLLLDGGRKSAGKIAQISYLANGLSWAPSYRVDLTDAKRLTIEQSGVIRNELIDLNDTEVSVISGYPSVQFGQVVSPLAATQTWGRFFQQLGSKSASTAFNNSIITQNQFSAYNMDNNSNASGPTIAPNSGDTIDLHYHSIGRRALKRGDALAFTTGTAQVDYERVVEWSIPDNRDEWGTPTNNRRMDPSTGEQLQDDVWDALKFKNQLPFPMTSAPATVTTAGKFSGQGQVLWTNRNEVATLRVNKALSIRARHVEYENQVAEQGQAERDIVYLGGRRFRKVTVNGELRLCNHRTAEAKMIIKRQFSGDYVTGDDSPKLDLREEGVWTVNRRNELQWTMVLKPSEERTVKYQYSVLISF